MDNVWNFLFGTNAKDAVPSIADKIALCPEAVITMLIMVRKMLNQENKSPESLPVWLRDYPVTIIQFLFFLYHNMKDLMPTFMSGEVLNALASTLFPRCSSSDSESSTPGNEVIKPTNLIMCNKANRNLGPLQCLDGEDAVIIKNDQDGGLTSHPAKKLVLDFLRAIVVDSLSLPAGVTSKVLPVVDLALEVIFFYLVRFLSQLYFFFFLIFRPFLTTATFSSKACTKPSFCRL